MRSDGGSGFGSAQPNTTSPVSGRYSRAAAHSKLNAPTRISVARGTGLPRDLITAVTTRLDPDIVLFDLPPMTIDDDALAFLPKVDATLLVVAAGVTTAAQVDECERQISQTQKLLGVVLNKCEGRMEEYYP